MLAPVRYDDAIDCGEHEPWLVKRKAFEHEKEVRLGCEIPFDFDDLFEAQVELTTLIEKIVVTPFAPQWQIDSVFTAINALLKQSGVDGIRVEKSEHMNAPSIGWPPEIKDFNAALATFFEKLGTNQES